MISILVISKFKDEFLMYIRSKGIKINLNQLFPNPLVTNIAGVEVSYFNTIESDKILSNTYDKIVFISRPKWIIDLEANDKTNIVNYLYDNNLIKQTKYNYIK